MTHPFYPLLGREFEQVETITVVGVDWVYYTGDDGPLRTLSLGSGPILCKPRPAVQHAVARERSRALPIALISANPVISPSAPVRASGAIEFNRPPPFGRAPPGVSAWP